MKRFAALSAILSLFLYLLTAPFARAQFLDSSVGVSGGLVKLFGTQSGFSARTDVQVLDTNRQETLRTPMNFALLDGKVRMDFEMTLMRGKAVQPAIVNGMKQIGLDRVASIIRLDKRITHVLFAGAASYVDMEISPADAEAAEKNVQVQRTALGKETLDKHPCTKNKMVVRNAKGMTLLEATTWNAEDLKDFPVQIAVQAKEGTTIMHFTQIQLARPAAAQFEVPASYTKYGSAETLMLAATQKQMTSPKSNAPSKGNARPTSRGMNTPAKSPTASTKPAVRSLNPPVPAAKTNAVTGSARKPLPAKK